MLIRGDGVFEHGDVHCVAQSGGSSQLLCRFGLRANTPSRLTVQLLCGSGSGASADQLAVFETSLELPPFAMLVPEAVRIADVASMLGSPVMLV